MREPAPTRPPRAPQPALHVGLFDGAFQPCADLPDAMRALLDTLALREQASPEPAPVAARR